jgi:hypothetical protein
MERQPLKEAALAGSLLTASLGLAASLGAQEPQLRVDIVHASSGVDDAAARAAREANYPVFAAANDIKILIESFRLMAEDALDAPPARLSAPRRRLFEALQQAVEQLQKAAHQPPDAARETLIGTRHLRDDAAAVVGEGQLLAAGPSVLAPSFRDEAHFTIRGVSLDRSEPRLFVGGIEATRLTLSPQRAVFAIPSSALPSSETSPSVYSGRLVLAPRVCSLWVICRSIPREYTVSLLLLPERLANVQISFNRKVHQRAYEQVDPPADSHASKDRVYSRSFEYSSDDLTLMSCNSESQAPHAGGYVIDTDSLIITVKSSTGETRSRLSTATTEGFTVELCAQAQISQLVKTGGWISVQATWKEYRMDDVLLPAESLAPQTLRWGAPLEVSVPPEASAIAIQVEYFDGSRVTYSGEASDEYLDLRWDAGRQHLQLTAHDPATIDGMD